MAKCLPGCKCGKHNGNAGRGNKPCPVDCTCQKHREYTKQDRENAASAGRLCEPGCSCGRHKDHTCPSNCTCDKHHSTACPPMCQCERHTYRERPDAGYYWHGGAEGDLYASILLPAGYQRHKYVWYGLGRYDCHELDFAHMEAKVNIELDGPYHYHTPAEDILRDSRLHALGWKIIRIKHG